MKLLAPLAALVLIGCKNDQGFAEVEFDGIAVVTGDFDYVLKVVATDLKTLSDFLLKTLAQLPGVNAVRSSVCLDEVKCSAALPIDS